MLIPCALYAEVHHKRGCIPNFLYKHEPEIIADYPYRVEPHIRNIPIAITIKDADRYPVSLREITVKLLFSQEKIIHTLFRGNQEIQERRFDALFFLEKTWPYTGDVPIIIEIRYVYDYKEHIIENNNYKYSGIKLHYIHFAESALPRLDNWYPGDIHYHSSYTDNDVEFGQTLAHSAACGKAIGLYYLGVTDHSYDMDNEDSKWETFKKDIRTLNTQNVDFVLLGGEEVSCGSSGGRNVHALAFGNDDFIAGYGDSGDSVFSNRPNISIEELSKRSPFTIAAHPYEGYSLFPYVFLRRGKWHDKDFSFVRGIEFYNGLRNRGYEKGKKKWIELLLSGKTIFAYAGCDAHGDFGFAYKVKVPFFKIRHCHKQIAGKVRTYVYAETKPTEQGILTALKSGRAVISDGPMIELTAEINGSTYMSGDTMSTLPETIKLRAKSTYEFGAISEAVIMLGKIGGKKEEILEKQSPESADVSLRTQLQLPAGKYYVRAEVKTDKDHIAMTNPIFLEVE